MTKKPKDNYGTAPVFPNVIASAMGMAQPLAGISQYTEAMIRVTAALASAQEEDLSGFSTGIQKNRAEDIAKCAHIVVEAMFARIEERFDDLTEKADKQRAAVKTLKL